jgi:hypothetical protein
MDREAIQEVVWYYRYYDHGENYIGVEQFKVLRRTPKGVWLDTPNGWPQTTRFVLDGFGKRYAYPTLEAAWASFRIRKMRHLQHLAAQHDRIKKIYDGINLIDPAEAIAHGVRGFHIGVKYEDFPFETVSLDTLHPSPAR